MILRGESEAFASAVRCGRSSGNGFDCTPTASGGRGLSRSVGVVGEVLERSVGFSFLRDISFDSLMDDGGSLLERSEVFDGRGEGGGGESRVVAFWFANGKADRTAT